MIARTHVIGRNGKCTACGTDLASFLMTTAELGDRIGKVETVHGGTRCYKIAGPIGSCV